MKLLHQAAQTLPLFIPMVPSERLPPLCGSVPAESSHISKPGDLVAALVKSSEGDENWILAEVVYFNSQTNKYEIDDIDEEQKERHMLSRRRVVALPTYRANPETHANALFPRKSLVLALYPQTTCFYRAIVQEQPKMPTEQYKVLFEDSSYSEGYSPPLGVPQRYVIMSKDMRKK
jgi:SAGA-associated factor 29